MYVDLPLSYVWAELSNIYIYFLVVVLKGRARMVSHVNHTLKPPKNGIKQMYKETDHQQHLNEAKRCTCYVYILRLYDLNDVHEISMGTASHGVQRDKHLHTHICEKCFILLNVKSLIAKPILVFISWRFSSSFEKLFWRLSLSLSPLCKCELISRLHQKPANQTCVAFIFWHLSFLLIPLLLLLLHLWICLLVHIFVYYFSVSISFASSVTLFLFSSLAHLRHFDFGVFSRRACSNIVFDAYVLSTSTIITPRVHTVKWN